jgi:hypothetical protein
VEVDHEVVARRLLQDPAIPIHHPLIVAVHEVDLFVGTVPAYEFFWSGEDYVSSHFRRYTRPSLARNLGAAGYEVLWSSHFNTLLFPLAASMIMAKRLFHPRDMYRSNVEPLPAWRNWLFRGIFSWERGLLRRLRLPFGLSVIVVARPREGARDD